MQASLHLEKWNKTILDLYKQLMMTESYKYKKNHVYSNPKPYSEDKIRWTDIAKYNNKK